MDDLSPVSLLLKKARRRTLLDLVLDQSALAISIAMAGAILLLLTGASLLDWYWIALLAIASLAAGLYRLRGRVPSEYRLAQRIDWKLNLADALSTAKYFADEDSPIVDRQRASAEEIARTIDPRVAAPFSRSRFAWPAMGLALVACGLFAVRYAVLDTLSLQPSLVKVAFDTFFGTTPQQQARNHPKSPADHSPIDPGNPDAPTTQNEQVPDSQLQSVETPDVNNALSADASKAAAKVEQKPTAPDETAENGEKGDKGESNADDSKDEKGDKAGDKSKDGKQKDSKQDAQRQNGNTENSSMLDKLKDAMANMLNKMKSQSKDSESAQNSKESQSANQQKGNNQKNAQKGQQSESQEADSKSEQQPQDGDKNDPKQSANSKAGEKSADKNKSPDAKSGIGSSDGDKSAKEAAELQAMGKISEIIGKRSQNVSGEVMVEVGSTRQQLKTPWAQKQATHVEAGGEINRDEVPLMYQQFVEQYFEEIRKAPAKPAPKPN